MDPPPPPSPRIPAITEPCPSLTTGEVSVLGKQVRLWVGARRDDVAGPIYLYWHGTGGYVEHAQLALGESLNRITEQGGLVAAFSETLGTGTPTSNATWNTGDYALADIIVACAVEQLNIDTRRIYTAGCSAGGFQAGAMLYARSSYLAAAVTDSAGVAEPGELDAPEHVPSVLTLHGVETGLLIDTGQTSRVLGRDVAGRGGLAVNCYHAGGNCMGLRDDPTGDALRETQWRFLEDHPYGVEPDPYAAALPDTFPDYCAIVR